MKILLIRMSAIGDLIHTLPALSTIKKNEPTAEIHWLIKPSMKQLMMAETRIQKFHFTPKNPRDILAWKKLLQTIRQEKFDAVLDFQGLIKSALIACLSGAKRVISFNSTKEWTAPFYKERYPRLGNHVAEMNISLLRSAWPKWVASYDSNLAITPAGLEFGQDYFRQFPDNEPKIIVNVGGGWPTKRYAPEKLNSAINNAVERANITKWHALYGPGEKTDAQQATGTYGLLIPDNNIQEMLGLIAAADIFVSADTGPLHAAAALKTSCLGFFGPTPPSRNGPFNTKSVIVEKHCPLQYCFRRSCKLDFCLQTLPPEKLEEGLLALINDWKNKE